MIAALKHVMKHDFVQLILPIAAILTAVFAFGYLFGSHESSHSSWVTYRTPYTVTGSPCQPDDVTFVYPGRNGPGTGVVGCIDRKTFDSLSTTPTTAR